MFSSSIRVAAAAVPDHRGDILVFMAAILAGEFFLHPALVRLMRPSPVWMMHAAIPRQACQVVIIAAAIPADVSLALRTREQLMLSLSLGMSRTAIGQQ